MFVSVFDLFKRGIGPSSSHTVGPMIAAGRFLDRLRDTGGAVARLDIHLHGSLAHTGVGHGTDRAVILGLLGQTPDAVDPDAVEGLIAQVARTGRIAPPGLDHIAFDPATHIHFEFVERLEHHSNGLRFRAQSGDGALLDEQVYYSVGGGFVLDQAEMAADRAATSAESTGHPYPFRGAAEMLEMGEAAGLTIAEMKRANEATVRPAAETDAGLDALWGVMDDCIARGMARDGELPGGLGVKRRAKAIAAKLEQERQSNRRYEHAVMDWISLYALAVNEENAAGGRVVTAPTNGAAGVIPSVIRYYLDFCPDADQAGVRDFLLVAAAIGGLIKHNASISGAEVGCQGEVGSASAMAAAGLAAVLGGSNGQVEHAAEIALEHHLGMTCDPIAGLVQIPCIERNAMGAVKAINASRLAFKGDGTHYVSLDKVIKTMLETGRDMESKYKETALGGLAVNVVAC